MAQLLIVIIAFLLVHHALVEAQQATQPQIPALPSGMTDKLGWPLPRWWKQYRQRFGKFCYNTDRTNERQENHF